MALTGFVDIPMLQQAGKLPSSGSFAERSTFESRMTHCSDKGQEDFEKYSTIAFNDLCTSGKD